MTDPIAALPMYDWPEVRAEVDAEWAAIRDRLRAAGVDAPERLARCNADMPPVPGGIRDHAGNVVAPDPATLPPDAFDLATLWRHPKLVFGQTCWGPMETTDLARHVRVIGQPSYDGYEGGAGQDYSSAIVMRRTRNAPPSGLPAISPSRGEIGSEQWLRQSSALQNGRWRSGEPIPPLEGEMAGRPEGGIAAPADGRAVIPLDRLRGLRLAFSEPHSMSGLLALSRDLKAQGESLGMFSARVETGGHRLSIIAVAEGRADVATIDCRSWALAKRFEPATRAVEAVGWTARRKGLPFIAARGMPDDLFDALRGVLAA